MNALRKASQEMSSDEASMILRRKPQSQVEFRVAKIAVAALACSGLAKREIEREAGRKLTLPEELAILEALGEVPCQFV